MSDEPTPGDTCLAGLSDRQLDVLRLLDERLTVKEIADRLGVSDTRVGQHIRTIKDKLGEETLAGLVAIYRAEKAAKPPLVESTSRKKEVPQGTLTAASRRRDEAGLLAFQDAAAFPFEAPWKGLVEPRIVPEALDGDNAGILRMAAMVGIALGVIIAAVVLLTAMDTLSTLLRSGG